MSPSDPTRYHWVVEMVGPYGDNSVSLRLIYSLAYRQQFLMLVGWVTKLIATSFNQPCTITLVRGGGNRQSCINLLILRRIQADGPTFGCGLLAILACLGLFRATNARHGSSKMELISVIPFRSRNCLG